MDKGMPIRDSLSRCNNYSDVYSVIRNPRAPIIVETKEADEIETTQERLEREILEKFQNEEFRLENESASFLISAGKFVFTTLMLPPYLLFYKLPKLILIDGLGAIIDKSAQAAESLLAPLLRPFQFLHRRTATIEKVDDKPEMDFIAMARNGIYSLGNKVFHPLFQSVKWLMNGIQWTKKNIQFLAGIAYAVAAPAVRTAGKFAVKYAERIAKRIGSRLYETLIQPVVAWHTQKINSFKKGIKSLATGAVLLAKGVKYAVVGLATDPLETIKEAAYGIGNGLRALGQHIVRKSISWVNKKIEAFLSPFRKSAEFIRKQSRKIIDLSERAKQKFKKTAQTIMEWPQNLAAMLPAFLQNAAPGWLKNWISNRAAFIAGSYRKVIRLAGWVFRTTSRILAPVRRLSRHLANRIRKIIDLSQRFFKWLAPKLKALPRLAAKKALELAAALWRYTRKILLWIRVFFAWITVICKLGMQLVRELTEEIGHWFSPSHTR